MNIWEFKSVVFGSEINLNDIASHFGIKKKFKWEDPLVLSDNTLKGILKSTETKSVYLYYFGSMVFINMEFHEIQDVVKYLKTIDTSLKIENINEYTDDYRLEINPEYEYSLGNEVMTASIFEDYYVDIISMVLAKSISLYKIEHETDNLLDNIEDVIGYLERGNFNISDKQLAKSTARVIRFEYNTIANLMLFEKPSGAWYHEDIDKFYIEMVALFDIEDRYSKITHKTEILKDITDVFGSLTHGKRATRLEIMVIVLIAVSLSISLLELFTKYFL
jgi:required for meiotic nuclear division protein 1